MGVGGGGVSGGGRGDPTAISILEEGNGFRDAPRRPLRSWKAENMDFKVWPRFSLKRGKEE